jgi:hypothetical protein
LNLADNWLEYTKQFEDVESDQDDAVTAGGTNADSPSWARLVFEDLEGGGKVPIVPEIPAAGYSLRNHRSFIRSYVAEIFSEHNVEHCSKILMLL